MAARTFIAQPPDFRKPYPCPFPHFYRDASREEKRASNLRPPKPEPSAMQIFGRRADALFFFAMRRDKNAETDRDRVFENQEVEPNKTGAGGDHQLRARSTMKKSKGDAKSKKVFEQPRRKEER